MDSTRDKSHRYRYQYRAKRISRIQMLIGYDCSQHHGNLIAADIEQCDCGQPVTHIEYVVVGTTTQGRTEPLPLCADCHRLFVVEERTDRTPIIVPCAGQQHYHERIA